MLIMSVWITPLSSDPASRVYDWSVQMHSRRSALCQRDHSNAMIGLIGLEIFRRATCSDSWLQRFIVTGGNYSHWSCRCSECWLPWLRWCSERNVKRLLSWPTQDAPYRAAFTTLGYTVFLSSQNSETEKNKFISGFIYGDTIIQY